MGSIRQFADYYLFHDRFIFPRWAYGLHPELEGRTLWEAGSREIRLDLPVRSRKGDRPVCHADHLEMSGFHVSAIVSYGTDRRGRLRLHRHLIWPSLRMKPNLTSDALSHGFGRSFEPSIILDGREVPPFRPDRFRFDGVLTIEGTLPEELSVTRTLFPHMNAPVLTERYVLRNNGGRVRTVEAGFDPFRHLTNGKKGVYGSYLIGAECDFRGSRTLEPGESLEFNVNFFARKSAEEPVVSPPGRALAERNSFAEEISGSLILETPEPELDLLFRFAKIRLSESIYRTRRGLLHGPGGGCFYAAIWTNDQCEYANPLFPFLGYPPGNEQALNGFRLYGEYMDPEFRKPLVSSIIAEGTDFWNGAGDRGDAAMYAYGAARFALAGGDDAAARELWPLIQWALEYCRRQIDEAGVVRSDSDELENRFPSGSANLSTNILYYDALLSSAFLAEELGEPDTAAGYREEVAVLAQAVESFFGAEVEGFRTYRYYRKNRRLRSWICLPLTAGLMDRKEGTLDALFSDRLWTREGLLSVSSPRNMKDWRMFDFEEVLKRFLSSSRTFWDRATLYGLRGAFNAGAADTAAEKLLEFSRNRLLGSHVPYPVEAFPEGNRKHLSAESALYCRVFTEGLFGIRPAGFRSFAVTPRVPASWDRAALRSIRAFGSLFDLEVVRTGKGTLQLTVLPRDGEPFVRTLREGETAVITLAVAAAPGRGIS